MRSSFRKRGGLRIVLLLLSLVSAAAIAACGSSNKSSTSGSTAASGAKAKTDCPVRVALIDNFTGAGAQNGTANKAGAQIAIDDVNKAGGVLGCPIQMDTFDDGSDYSKDPALMQKALSSGKYKMVWNGDFGCVTSAPLITRAKALSISGCAQTNFADKANPTIFDVTPIAGRGAMVAAQYGLKKGYKKWALLVDSTELGRGDQVAMSDLIKKGGGTVTDVERLDLSGINFSSAVQRAKASNPDVIFTDLFGAAAGHLKHDIQTSGWNVPQIGGDNEAATAFKGLVPLNAVQGNGNVVTGPISMSAPPDKAHAAFISALKAKGVAINEFLYGYINAHDPIVLFSWAANQVGSLDPSKMADKLHNSGNVKIPGLLQGDTTGYTPTCGEWNPQGGMAIMKAGFYTDGTLPLVEKATAPPLPQSLNDC